MLRIQHPRYAEVREKHFIYRIEERDRETPPQIQRKVSKLKVGAPGSGDCPFHTLWISFVLMPPLPTWQKCGVNKKWNNRRATLMYRQKWSSSGALTNNSLGRTVSWRHINLATCWRRGMCPSSLSFYFILFSSSLHPLDLTGSFITYTDCFLPPSLKTKCCFLIQTALDGCLNIYTVSAEK